MTTNGPKVMKVSYGAFSCTLQGFEDDYKTLLDVTEYFRKVASESPEFGALSNVNRDDAARQPTQTPDAIPSISYQHSDESVDARSDLEDLSKDLNRKIAEQKANGVEDHIHAHVDHSIAEKFFTQNAENQNAIPVAITAAATGVGAALLVENGDFSDLAVLLQADDEQQDSPQSENEGGEPQTINEVVEDSSTLEKTIADVSQGSEADRPAPTDVPNGSDDEFRFEDVPSDAQSASEGHVDIQGSDETTTQEDEAQVTQAPQSEARDQVEKEDLSISAESAENSTDNDGANSQEAPAPFTTQDDTVTVQGEDTLSPQVARLADILAPKESGESTAPIAEPQTAEPEPAEEAQKAAPPPPQVKVVKKSQLENAEKDSAEQDPVLKLIQASSLSYEDQNELLDQLEAIEAMQEPLDETELDETEAGEFESEDALPSETPRFKLAAISDDALEEFEEDAADEPQADVPVHYDDLTELSEGEAEHHEVAIENDNEIERLMEKARAERDAPESARRRETIAHLKAAATAGDQDQSLTAAKEKTDTNFRSDLAAIVNSVKSGRESPMLLGAEQRVKPGAADEHAEHDDAQKVVPVRPRRQSQPSPDAALRFRNYVTEVGASDLLEIVEAAASYLTFVDGFEEISRAQVMIKVHQVVQDDFSRDDSLDCFAALVNEGKLERRRVGRFAVSNDIGYRPDQAATA